MSDFEGYKVAILKNYHEINIYFIFLGRKIAKLYCRNAQTVQNLQLTITRLFTLTIQANCIKAISGMRLRFRLISIGHRMFVDLLYGKTKIVQSLSVISAHLIFCDLMPKLCDLN